MLLTDTGDGTVENVFQKVDQIPGYTATEEYSAKLAGRSFEAEGGQKLSFYEDEKAAYDFTNGVGDKYHYEYDYTVREIDSSMISVAFRTIKTGEVEFATILPDIGIIEYYVNIYYET